MTAALFSGLSGLRANQQYLNVIGNNLANSNTTGYKSSRVTFGDVLSETIRRGSAPNGGLGGTNSIQLGRGAGVASVDQSFAQGSLLSTGRALDLAIQGEGFFTVANGSATRYTRVGAFGTDASQNLVDIRTGFRVQAVGGGDIKIPLSSIAPPNASANINVRGNLPAEINGPTIESWTSVAPYKEAYAAQTTGATSEPFDLSANNALVIKVNGVPKAITIDSTNLPFGADPAALSAAEVASALNNPVNAVSGFVASAVGGTLRLNSSATGSDATLEVTGSANSALGFAAGVSAGTESLATGTTALNDLKTNTKDYSTNDKIRVTVTLANGNTVAQDFVFGVDGTTLGSLANFANSLYGSDATLALDGSGRMQLLAADQGTSGISLTFADVASSAGGVTNFGATELENTVEGQNADVANLSVPIYDSLGIEHVLSVKFERQITGEWLASPSLAAQDGVISSASFPILAFSNVGTLSGTLSGTVDIAWAGAAAPQTVKLTFSDPALGAALTQVQGSASIAATQDGYPPGKLDSIGVEQDGTITGTYSNGRSAALAQIAIAVFTNPAGLTRDGDGLFSASNNSGTPANATPGAGGAGTIASGALEGSNVDVAEEFVRLIEAQRGFQANARVISTSNEILAELSRLGQ